MAREWFSPITLESLMELEHKTEGCSLYEEYSGARADIWHSTTRQPAIVTFHDLYDDLERGRFADLAQVELVNERTDSWLVGAANRSMRERGLGRISIVANEEGASFAADNAMLLGKLHKLHLGRISRRMRNDEYIGLPQIERMVIDSMNHFHLLSAQRDAGGFSLQENRRYGWFALQIARLMADYGKYAKRKGNQGEVFQASEDCDRFSDFYANILGDLKREISRFRGINSSVTLHPAYAPIY